MAIFFRTTYRRPKGRYWVARSRAGTNAWDFADKQATVTLTNSDRTATSSAASSTVRSSTSHTNGAAGKYYVEFLINVSVGGTDVGMKSGAGALAGFGSDSVTVGLATGNVRIGGSGTSPSLGAFIANDVLCMAWDPVAELVWFRKNNGLWNNNAAADPAAGTNGVNIAVFSAGTPYELLFIGGSTASVTLRADSAALTVGSYPSGFTSWMGETLTLPAVGTGALNAGIGTNYLYLSQDIEQWSLADTEVVVNNVVAPDGTMTADTCTSSTWNSQHALYPDGAAFGGTTNASIYAKVISGPAWVQISHNSRWANFNLATGAVGNSNTVWTEITDAGNGWWRCALFNQYGETDYKPTFHILPSDINGQTPAHDIVLSVAFWGAQLESSSSSTPTAYLKTGVTAYIAPPRLFGVGSATFPAVGTGTLVAAYVGIDPIAQGATVYVNFLTNKGYVKGTGNVAISTLLGNDPALDAIYRVTGYDPTGITEQGFLFQSSASGKVPAFIGALRADVLAGKSVVVKFQSAPTGTPQGYISQLLPASGSPAVNFDGWGGNVSIGGAVAYTVLPSTAWRGDTGANVVNAVGYTVLPNNRFDIAANNAESSTTVATASDTPQPLVATYFESYEPIASIAVYDTQTLAGLLAKTAPVIDGALSGIGIVVSQPVTGTGTLTATTATLVGAGVSRSVNTAQALVAVNTTGQRGAGVSASSGTAALVAVNTTGQRGAGVSASINTLTALVAVNTSGQRGAGLSSSTGTAVLPGAVAALAGVGVMTNYTWTRPGSDVAADGWTDQAGGVSNIYTTLDEPYAANDSDYVKSPTGAGDLVVRLFEGSTQIATWSHVNPPDTFTTAEQTLTTPQYAAISDFSNLFVEFDDSQSNVYRLKLGATTFADPPVTLRYRYKKTA